MNWLQERRHRERLTRLRSLADSRSVPPADVSLALKIARKIASHWPEPTFSEGIDHDDLVSEAMIGAWIALLTYDPARGRKSAWVGIKARIAVQEACSRHDAREEATHRRVSLYDDAANLVETLLEEDERIARLPERLDVERLLVSLPTDREREVVRLYIWEGWTLEEIARRIDRSPSMTSAIWRGACRRMREAVSETR